MTQIHVLVIDDSAFMRKMITDILTSDGRIEVIGTARNGKDGLEKISELSPDVVTMDIEMPIMDGISALQQIMAKNPLPVVMLSSLTTEGASRTIEAISIGAVDFIAKPSGSISLDIAKIATEIIEKVVAAASANLVKQRTTKTIELKRAKPSLVHAKTVVVMGTSTGGPKALQRVLTNLPKQINVPILIVQHMPPKFTKSLADRLDRLANIHVKEAEHGEIIQKNTAYIAPGNYHMRIKQIGPTQVIELTQTALCNGHRPAVDELFSSLAQVNRVNKLAIVLTGMGHDGTKGVQTLKKMDPNTIVIAESKESAIVYGMPKSVVQVNEVHHIVHLDHISETMMMLLDPTEGI